MNNLFGSIHVVKSFYFYFICHHFIYFILFFIFILDQGKSRVIWETSSLQRHCGSLLLSFNNKLFSSIQSAVVAAAAADSAFTNRAAPPECSATGCLMTV